MLAALLAAALCSPLGAAPMTAPDNSPECTPGSTVVLTKKQACTPTDRGSTPASIRRDVLARYGVPDWSGQDGEIDHRVPWFLTHETSRRNLWPEAGPIPNPKDKLEFYVYRRVCNAKPHPMSVRTARLIFLGDWRVYFRRYLN